MSRSEYFSHNDQRFTSYKDGRQYHVTQRPWYKETVEKNVMFVAPIHKNDINLKVNSAIQLPVYKNDGTLIGVAGVDVELTAIVDIIDKLRYQGMGESFMINSKGTIMYIPAT